MTKRQFDLLALALFLAFAIAFLVSRKPVCFEGGSMQLRTPGVKCGPQAPDYERRSPGGTLVMMSGSGTLL